MRRSIFFAALSLALHACGQDEGAQAGGNFFSPGVEAVQVLVFPTVEVGEESSVEAVVRSRKQPLFLQPIELDPPFSSDLNAVEKLEPERERRIRFTFRPTEPGTIATDVLVRASGSIGRYRLEAEALPEPEPCLPTAHTDTFAEVRSVQDVLVVIDDHRSMEGVRDALLAQAPALLERLDEVGIDWRLAVTTAGFGASCPGGTLRDGTPIAAGEEDAAARLDAALRAPVCAGESRGIEAVATAGPDFVRDGAGLALVVVSTRDDRSPAEVREYVSALGRTPVRALVVVGDDGGRCALAEPGTRWAELASLVGGARRSLCAEDWALGDFFSASSTFGVPLDWKLSEWPWDDNEDGMIRDDDGEIEVRIDGVAVPSRTGEGKRIWSYDGSGNAISFFPETAPRPGQRIDVTYDASCPTASRVRATSPSSL